MTWRSRQSADRPLGIKPTEETAAECAASFRLGPMTFAAVVELAFRVRILQGLGSITPDGDPEEPVDVSIRRKLPDDSDGDESDALREHLNAIDQTVPTLLVTFHDDSFGGSLNLGQIYKDETGAFWIQASCIFNSSGHGFNLVSYDLDDVPVAVNLVLACGTFPFVMFLPEDCSGDLEISATEWHAYKTSAGADAYDTATGLVINGGPGA